MVKKTNPVLRGVYTLLITLNTPSKFKVGQLGKISFSSGYYAYVGSALNGLSSRIARHLRQEKAVHWHIDYFLQEGIVKDIIYGLTDRDKECVVALQLEESLIPIFRFGCSDCRCKSHLFYCNSRIMLKKVIKTGFKNSGLVPKVWR